MKSQVEPGELLERIRKEARRQQANAYPTAEEATGENAGGLPPAPAFVLVQPAGFSCETLLAQVGNMIERARMKTTVGKGTPKLLRPLKRNQGGYNDIVLEALVRLRETSAQLMAENAQLRLHIQRQTEWMRAVERTFAHMEERLEKFGESPIQDEL